MNKITQKEKPASYKRNILAETETKTKQTKHHISLVSQLQIENKYKISTTSINNIYRTNKKG